MDVEEQIESPQTARLKVSHPQAGNLLGRGLNLSLDDGEWAHLKAGKAFSIRIEPGRHHLRVDNTFHKKTVEFNAQVGEQVHYSINNMAGWLGAFMITVLGAGPIYLDIQRVVDGHGQPSAHI